MYEIFKLVNEVISESAERKREVILKLGYKNLNKGYRRLNTLLEKGVCPEFIKENLPKALNIDKELIDFAFEVTKKQKAKETQLACKRREEYERKHFKPHIWIEHERKYPQGGSICIVAFIGIDKFKMLALPENINEIDWEIQQSKVKEHILQHQKEVDTVDIIFGKVKGYTYCQTYDNSFLFSIDGKLLKRNLGKIEKPNLYIQIGNKNISGGLIAVIKYRK